jgi:hypothetical protein
MLIKSHITSHLFYTLNFCQVWQNLKDSSQIIIISNLVIKIEADVGMKIANSIPGITCKIQFNWICLFPKHKAIIVTYGPLAKFSIKQHVVIATYIINV